MKDLKEVFDALLAGETLVLFEDDDDSIYIDEFGNLILGKGYSNISPEWVSIKEPKWYKNLNGREVICSVKFGNKESEHYIIKAYRQADNSLIDTNGNCHNPDDIFPLSNEKIRMHLDTIKHIKNGGF